MGVEEASLSNRIRIFGVECVDGLEASIWMMEFKESTQNYDCHYDKLYDKTQEITAQAIGSIEHWRKCLEKALEREPNARKR